MDPLHPNAPLDLDPTLGAIARSLLRIDTLQPRGRDSLDFHDVGVAALALALEAALRVGYAAGQAGVPLARHAPSYADAPDSGVDHLSSLLRQLGVDPRTQVEPGYPQNRADYEQQRTAGTLKRRRLG